MVEIASSDNEKFEFGEWNTPFKDDSVELLEANYSSVDSNLLIRVRAAGNGALFLVRFENVYAFRVLDEHGLLNIWEKTKQFGGRPAQTTFKARNSLWTMESPVSFLNSDGWSFILATGWDCVEIVTRSEPTIIVQG